MISLLTPTGARPEAFAACVEMMQAQDYAGPVRWVIVDDGPVPVPVPTVRGWEVITVRPWPLWREGQNTQARNLLAGLDYCTDMVAVIEDDDRYSPWWVRSCAERLQESDLIGESHALYRHICNGNEKPCNNSEHASLCSTAMKGDAVAHFRRICEDGDTFIDLRLWRDFAGSKRLYAPEPRGVVGLKGWPGRGNIGMGARL